jgi:hypothetical protein
MEMKVKIAVLLIVPFMIMISCKKETAKKAPSVFIVQSVVGDVLVKRSGSEIKAVKGLALNGNDTVVTEKKAMVDILFGTEGVIRINEQSSLVINSVQSDEQTLNAALNLEKGKEFFNECENSNCGCCRKRNLFQGFFIRNRIVGGCSFR